MQTLQGAISLPCCRHPRQTHPMPFNKLQTENCWFNAPFTQIQEQERRPDAASSILEGPVFQKVYYLPDDLRIPHHEGVGNW